MQKYCDGLTSLSTITWFKNKQNPTTTKQTTKTSIKYLSPSLVFLVNILQVKVNHCIYLHLTTTKLGSDYKSALHQWVTLTASADQTAASSTSSLCRHISITLEIHVKCYTSGTNDPLLIRMLKSRSASPKSLKFSPMLKLNLSITFSPDGNRRLCTPWFVHAIISRTNKSLYLR